MNRQSATLDLEPGDLLVDGFDVNGGALAVVLPGGGEVASTVVVRIAGLPAATLRDLRFAASFSLARTVVRLLQRLNAEAETLSNDLFLDIPERCFVRMNDIAVTDAPKSERQFDKSRKPVYVEFANWYLVQAFERMLRAAGPALVFEEALPSPDDAPGPEDGNG